MDITPELLAGIGAIISNCFLFIVGALGVIFGYLTNRQMQKDQRQKDERKEIYKKLNAFYGPFKQRLEKTWELYQIFAKNRDRDSFRTLDALLKGEKFEGNDKILLEEILELGKEMEQLVLAQGGLIDDPELRQLLVKAGTHFRVLRLAYEGRFRGDTDRFQDYVYPRELDKKLDQQIRKLTERLDELNKA